MNSLQKQTQKALVLDIETDGLDPTVIWCCATSNGEVYYDAKAFNTMLESLDSDYTLVAHNGIAYDFPVLSRLWGSDLSRFKKLDTLVLSRLADPSREGGHSLGNWGKILGFPKGDYNDWTHLNHDMVVYCKQDVAVNVKVLERLIVELGHFKDEAVELEHEVQTIIAQQIKNGWLLDQRKAFDLLSELKERQYELEAEVHAVFVPLPTFVSEVTPKIKKNGEVSIVGIKFIGEGACDIVGGSFSRIDYPDFNLGSRKQIGRYLQYFGWEPKEFTETGQPKVDETILSKVEGIPQAQLIAEYLMVQKRIAQVSSWVDAVNPETDRVHGYVNSNGAVTGRMTHSSPNVAQVPASNAPYGENCRSCWTVPTGFKQSGGR